MLLYLSRAHFFLLMISVTPPYGYIKHILFIGQLYMGGDLLDQMVSVCLTFKHMTKMLQSGYATLYSTQQRENTLSFEEA